MGNHKFARKVPKYSIFLLKTTNILPRQGWAFDWRPGFLLELSVPTMSKTSDPRDPALEKKVTFPRSWGRESLGMCTIQRVGSALTSTLTCFRCLGHFWYVHGWVDHGHKESVIKPDCFVCYCERRFKL